MREIDRNKLITYLEREIKTGKLISKNMRKTHRECSKDLVDLAPKLKSRWNELAYWGSGKWNALNQLLQELLYGSFDKRYEK